MIILDSSTALVALQHEDGLDLVAGLLETQACAMSSINYSEVYDKLVTAGASHRRARAMFDALKVRLIPFGRLEAEVTAALRQRMSTSGIGIADRACVATGLVHDAPIFTADRDWERIDVPEVDIRFVR